MREIDLPTDGSQDFKIRVHTVGICGSDFHYYEYEAIGPVRRERANGPRRARPGASNRPVMAERGVSPKLAYLAFVERVPQGIEAVSDRSYARPTVLMEEE